MRVIYISISFDYNLALLYSIQLAIKSKNLSTEETDRLIEEYQKKSSDLLDFLSDQICDQAQRSSAAVAVAASVAAGCKINPFRKITELGGPLLLVGRP